MSELSPDFTVSSCLSFSLTPVSSSVYPSGLLSQSNSVGVHTLCVILLGNESDASRERWKEATASSYSAD